MDWLDIGGVIDGLWMSVNSVRWRLGSLHFAGAAATQDDPHQQRQARFYPARARGGARLHVHAAREGARQD